MLKKIKIKIDNTDLRSLFWRTGRLIIIMIDFFARLESDAVQGGGVGGGRGGVCVIPQPDFVFSLDPSKGNNPSRRVVEAWLEFGLLSHQESSHAGSKLMHFGQGGRFGVFRGFFIYFIFFGGRGWWIPKIK